MTLQTIEIPVKGMDCNECVQHVTHAIAALPGVEQVSVYLASEKASIQLDPVQVPLDKIRQAVAAAGYSVPLETGVAKPVETSATADFSRQLGTLLAIVFGAILFVVVIGEWLGLFSMRRVQNLRL